MTRCVRSMCSSTSIPTLEVNGCEKECPWCEVSSTLLKNTQMESEARKESQGRRVTAKVSVKAKVNQQVRPSVTSRSVVVAVVCGRV